MFIKIPRFQLPFSYSDFWGVLKDSLFDIEDPEPIIREYERSLEDYIGCGRVFSVPSARLGLQQILKGLNIKEGDEIILPAWTYFAVPSILSFCKVKPIFVDIDPETCNMDPSDIEKTITKNTKAIIATHLYGLPLEMDRVIEIAGNHRLKIIEDCAQSFGATYDGKRTGSFGNAAFFSFGMTKNYTTISGGLIAINDEECAETISKEIQAFDPQKKVELLAKTVKGLVMKFATSPIIFSASVYPFLRLFSIFDRDIINTVFDEVPFEIKRIPTSHFKSNINAVQAKLGKAQLKKIDDSNMLRHSNGVKLSLLLEDQEGIKIVKGPKKSYNIYLSFPIQHKQRLKLKKHLLKRGIDTTEGFLRNCPSLPIFKDFHRECPNSARLEAQILHIPIYPSLSDDMIAYIADTIRNFAS